MYCSSNFANTLFQVVHSSTWTLLGAIWAEIGVEFLLRHLLRAGSKIKVGNAGTGEQIINPCVLNNLYSELLSSVLIAPVWEEIAFRGIPLLTLAYFQVSPKSSLNKIVGLISTLLFAIGHNGVWVLNNLSQSQFYWNWLPLPQFILGYHLWHVCNKHGLRWAIFAHALLNLIMLVVATGKKCW